MPSRIRATTAVFGAAALIAACSVPAEKPSPPAVSATTTPSAGASATPTPDATPSLATPLVANVISAPIPVPATDGKVHLAYELQLTNVLAQDVTLTSVVVRSGDQTLLKLPGDRLGYWTRLIGTPIPATKLGPAVSAVVWLDVALDESAPMPKQLVHAVGISMAEPMPPLFPATMTETVAPVNVQIRKPVLISAPLDGPNWLDASGCCDMTPHRTALNPINGQLWGAERFAVDYVQLGPDGRLFTGDRGKVESYPFFGADVHAVGDGPVVSAVDGLPEQVPGVNPTGLALDQYAGNHIVQELGDGNYALYAHIKTGSVKVKPGDRLTAGQVVGAVGNSGNSDAPHLHFHVMSTPDPLRSDGLPFVLSSFKLDSRLAELDAVDPILSGQPAQLVQGFPPREETSVSPLVLDVMSYGKL